MRYDLHLHPSSSHRRIERLVRADGRGPILDVGCAHGTLGELLARRRRHGAPAVPVDGIELDPAWADEARRHYRTVWTARAEDAPLPDGAYAIVVCADVLEHLPDPAATIRRLREAAAPGACFIISVPNVAHLAARLLLLAGRWPRMERGIFDRTHLHFWTLDTLTEVLTEGGLRIVAREATPVPLEQVWPAGRARLLLRVAMRAQLAAVRLLPRVFGFQWIIVAEPVPAAAGAGSRSVAGGAVDRHVGPA